jgi:hypothetical protein
MARRELELAVLSRGSSAFLATIALVLSVPTYGQVIQTETQKILPGDYSDFDGFGDAVAIDRNTIVVGAPFDSEDGFTHGSAYVFTSDGSRWQETQKLRVTDVPQGSGFGGTVAIDGNSAMIAALGDDSMGGETGSVYVFTFDGTRWQETQKLLASDAAANDWFGHHVAIDGDTAMVAATGDDDMGGETGSVYVFTFDGTRWQETQKLLASDAAADDWFGYHVAIDGDRAIIGAVSDDNDRGEQSGSAYVFAFDGSRWQETHKLTASDAGDGDRFGHSVAIDGDTVLVGNRPFLASAYVFMFDGINWRETQKITASDGGGYLQDSHHTIDIDIDENTAILSATGTDANSDCLGSTYVFTFDGSLWRHTRKLVAKECESGTAFGRPVALDGRTAIIGSAGFEDWDAEAAYVFELPRSAIVAGDDGPYVLDEGSALGADVNILDNDTDPEGDLLTPIVVDPPEYASFFQVMPDGTFDYTHDGGETQSDSFTYRASDGANESDIATVSFKITPVNDAPEIRLIGESTITVENGAVFNDPGATATDPEDGEISEQIVVGGDTVDTGTEGTYVITYNVSDSNDRAADEVVRRVIVGLAPVDQPPTIALRGEAAVTVTQGDSYTDAGATANDPEDGDLTDQIVIDNPVNTTTPGTYTVTYTVEDSAGHQVQTERTVIVEEAPPQQPPPQTRGAGGGCAVSPLELLMSTLMLLALLWRQQASGLGLGRDRPKRGISDSSLL